MRLAVSNIAWPAGADDEVAPLLREHGFGGVELALTKVWPEPLEVSAAELRAYRDGWEARGFRIVALQALLFGKPHLTLFDDDSLRRQTFDHLAGMIRCAGQLGAGALVFGSPKNRLRGALSPAEAREVAVPSFRKLGRVARDQGVTFCIEPNPAAYGCDFVTTADEGIELVDAVGDDGFGLHLDAAAMTLAGDAPAPSLAAAGKRCKHFHVSEPFLAEVGSGTVPHAEFARALDGDAYAGWVSVEMGEPKEARALGRALAFVRRTYAPGPLAA